MKRIIIVLVFGILLQTSISEVIAQRNGSQTITGTVVAIDKGTWRWQAIVVQSGNNKYFVYTFSTGYPDIAKVGVVDKIGKTVTVYYSKINRMQGYAGEIIPTKISEVVAQSNSNPNTPFQFSEMKEGEYFKNVVRPSYITKKMKFLGFSLNVPQNWLFFSGNNLLVFTPEGAYGEFGITHGIYIAGYPKKESLQTAAKNIIESTLKKSKDYSWTSKFYNFTLGGENALSTQISGKGKVFNRQEVVNFYISQDESGEIVYLFLIAPQNEYDSYNPVFRNIVESFIFSKSVGNARSNRVQDSANSVTFETFIDSYLNRYYKGWKVTAEAPYCNKEFQKSFVKGDFNGDTREDYVIKFTQGRKGYIIAFMRSDSSYKAHILENVSANEIKDQGLNIVRKGESYTTTDNFDKVKSSLPNDTPIGGTCESSTYFYMYQNGRFNRVYLSD